MMKLSTFLGLVLLMADAATIDAQSSLPLSGETSSPIQLPSDRPAGHQAASANAAVTTLSVLAFGAKADRVLLPGKNCTMANTSTTMSCLAARFTTADIGKSIGSLDIKSVFDVSTAPSVATITAVTDGTHVVLSRAAIKDTGGMTIEYGTDDVPAGNACVAAALASPGGLGTCKWPAGPYFLASAPNYMLWGAYDDGSYGQPAGGSGAVLTAVLSGGSIASVTVNNGGSGYTPNASLQTSLNNPTNQPTSGCGSIPRNNGPCGWAYVLAKTNASGVVKSTTVVYPGYGFTSVPSVTVIPLGGDGASLKANLTTGSISSVTVDAGGGGYPASVSNIPVYGVNGTGCAAITALTKNINAQGVAITAIGKATTNSSGAITSVSMSNGGSGCSVAPALIIGNNTCWSGAAFTAQCTNLPPLIPTKQPIQIGMATGVSHEGSASTSAQSSPGAELYGVWDGTADSNQPIMFGGDQYMAQYSINGIGMQNGFVCLASSFSMAVFRLENSLFSCGIGVYSAGQDNAVEIRNLSFFNYASMVSGGIWASRVDGPSITGGFNANNYPTSNIFYSATPYQSSTIPSAIDDWFANTFYHPEFSANATDYAETCTFPQTPAQRQTSHSIASPGFNGGGNELCYPGITNWGLIEMPKQFPRGNDHSIFNVIAVGNSRGLAFLNQGTKGVFSDGVCCEGGTQIVTDPYRAAPSLRGCIIETGAGQVVNTGCFISHGSILQSLYNPAGILGAGLPVGYPNSGWQNVHCVNGCTAEPNYMLADNYSAPGIVQNYNACTTYFSPSSAISTTGGYVCGTANGLALKSNNATDMLDVLNGGIKVNGGSLINANQGTGPLVQHSTGSTTTNDCAKFDANGNTIDSGAPCSSGPVNVTLTTTASVTISGTTGYYYNQDATAAAAVTYTLPAPAAGLHFCVKNSNNGSTANTGKLKILVANTGTQAIIYNGSASASGFIQSAGAAGDSACVIGISAAKWEAYPSAGVWSLY